MAILKTREEKILKNEKKHLKKKESYEAAGKVIYGDLRHHLTPKDGYTHVVMINSFSKWINQSMEGFHTLITYK